MKISGYFCHCVSHLLVDLSFYFHILFVCKDKINDIARDDRFSFWGRYSVSFDRLLVKSAFLLSSVRLAPISTKTKFKLGYNNVWFLVLRLGKVLNCKKGKRHIFISFLKTRNLWSVNLTLNIWNVLSVLLYSIQCFLM